MHTSAPEGNSFVDCLSDMRVMRNAVVFTVDSRENFCSDVCPFIYLMYLCICVACHLVAIQRNNVCDLDVYTRDSSTPSLPIRPGTLPTQILPNEILGKEHIFSLSTHSQTCAVFFSIKKFQA